jgi:hypothetical protein
MAVILDTAIPEQSTAFYSSLLTDEDDNPIAPAQLTSLTLTYYDQETESIINSRNFQNVLNTNNVTLGADGVLEWTLQSADTIIYDARKELEWHVALFSWLSLSGFVGRHEVKIKIENLSKVV